MFCLLFLIIYFYCSWGLSGQWGDGKILWGQDPWHQAIFYTVQTILALFLFNFIFKKERVYKIIAFILIFINFFFYLNTPASDDYHRYVVEGYITAQGENPYSLSPSIIADQQQNNFFFYKKVNFLIPSYLESDFKKVNHPEQTAIYGPVFHLLMSTISVFEIHLQLFKIIILLFTLLALWSINKLFAYFHYPKQYIYPLFLTPFYNLYFFQEAHNEIIPISFVLLAIICHYQKRYWFSQIFFTLAIGVKITYLIFIPIFFRFRKVSTYLLPFFLLFLYLPFDVFNVSPFDSLLYFKDLRFNNPIFYDFLPNLFSLDFLFLKNLAVIYPLILFVFIFLICLYTQDPLRQFHFISIFWILFSPTQHPWYYLLPLMANLFFQAFSIQWFLLFPLISLPFYHYYLTQGLWEEKNFLPIFYFFHITLYLFLIFDSFKFNLRKIFPQIPIKQNFNKEKLINRKSSNKKELDIIIPIYNDLAHCKEKLFWAKNYSTSKAHFYFVDGHSEDGTWEVLKKVNKKNITVLQTERGRGNQVQQAFSRGTSPFVLILHSDIKINDAILTRIGKAFKENKNSILLSFRMRYEKKLKSIEILNYLRAWFMGIPFGDQLQVIRRDKMNFFAIEFPQMPFLEDVEISLRLKPWGKLLFLADGGLVSARKWKKRGYLKNFITVVAIFHEYLFRRQFGLKIDSKKFYQKYYG